MTIEQIKKQLKKSETISFQLPNGDLVPAHFHVTEVGKVNKHFIDCGGTVREEVVANFQLWEADDYDHRLHPEKLVHIVELAQKTLEMGDLQIEVEYQGDTIGKYDLDHEENVFKLVPKKTACLAQEACGITTTEEGKTINSCSPESGCC